MNFDLAEVRKGAGRGMQVSERGPIATVEDGSEK